MSKYCLHCMAEINETAVRCPYCNSSQNIDVPIHRLMPGTELKGRYFVGEALGEGGFGITYIGYDILFQRKVAIKEYFPKNFVGRNNTASPTVYKNISEDRRFFVDKGLKKFLDEARVLGQFQENPGIVSVYDFFEENGTAYIVMEYLHGITLKSYIEKNGCIPAENLIPLLMPLMKTLDEVHKHNLIHRDISPDNIMFVEGADNVKLLDFGAARDYSVQEGNSMSIMLKPGYAPEEQYRSKGQQGPWTDVYALCATMYKCITGIRPDEAPDRAAEDDVKTLSELGVAINPYIEQVIMKGMSVYAKDRYSTIDEMIRAFDGADDEVTVPVGSYIDDTDSDTVNTEITFEGGEPIAAENQGEDTPSTGIKENKKLKNILLMIAGIVIAAVVVLVVNYNLKYVNLSKAEEWDDLKNGYKAVKMEGQWGMVNEKNRIILPFEYDGISIFENESLIEIKAEQGYGISDYEGNVIIPVKFYSIDSYDADKGLIEVWADSDISGIYNTNGELIVPVEYDMIFDEEDGIIKVKTVGYGGKELYGAYNTSGNVIIPAEYKSVYWREEAKAWEVETTDEKEGVYSSNGNIIIPVEYTRLYWRKEAKLWEVETTDEKEGAYNASGEIIIPIEYIHMYWEESAKGMKVETVDEKYGAYKANGEILIPIIYDYVYYSGKLWHVTTVDGKSGTFDSAGNVVDPAE